MLTYHDGLVDGLVDGLIDGLVHGLVHVLVDGLVDGLVHGLVHALVDRSGKWYQHLLNLWANFFYKSSTKGTNCWLLV